jgi:N-acetylglucosamine kinase-like BadF-type ATPase
LIADTDGRLVGTGNGPGANLTSHAPDRAFGAISAAVQAATIDVEPAQIQRAHIGTAGPENFKRPGVLTAFEQMWHDTGLRCPYDITSDLEVAFVAGTAQPDGTLLLCGTGAVAAQFEGRRRNHSADGHGWLLGDMGSGFWLGREAVRLTLATLGRLELPGPLGQEVIRTLLAAPEQPRTPRAGAAETAPSTATDSRSVPERLAALRVPADFRALADSLVMKVHAEPPIALARLAPRVSEAADADSMAAGILKQAADHLFGTVSTVRTTDGTPLVLAGSLLTADTPLRTILEPRLAEEWPKATITRAKNGAAGAAWLAATRILGADTEAGAQVHQRLVSAPD